MALGEAIRQKANEVITAVTNAPAAVINTVAQNIRDVTAATGALNNINNGLVLTLSQAWIGLSRVAPADTHEASNALNETLFRQKTNPNTTNTVGDYVAQREEDRKDSSKLYSLKLGDYYMPVSQTFTLRARKRLNVSELVDGIDIIQQTRKQAKTIDVILRIAIADDRGHSNLQIVDQRGDIVELAEVLKELYETDAVFAINNDYIKIKFGVEHVIMSEYRFIPRPAMGTFTFEFSLIEVKRGDNVLTFDLKEIGSAQNTGDITAGV